MKNILFVITLFVSNILLAQDKGIIFEHGTWKEAVAKAKQENKMIYVDFFTTWCGPCKLMSSKYFIDEKAGAKYNPLFVNFKIDAEKGEGIELAKKYNVDGYPTNLFIDSKTEKIIYQTMGCPTKIDGFLKNVDVAMLEKNDPMTIEQYKEKYKSKKYDEDFLKKLIEKNNRLGNLNDEYVDTYLAQYGSKMSDSEKFKFISTYYDGLTVKSKSFDYLVSLKNKNNVSEESLQQEIESLVYRNFEAAKITNSETELLKATSMMSKYYKNGDGYEYCFDDLNDFYEKNKNKTKLVSLYNEYGQYFSSINNQEIERRNMEAFNDNIRAQTQMMQLQGGVDSSKIDSIVKQKLLADQRDKIVSVSTAGNLNTICWNIYEKMPTNKSLVSKSLVWIQRAMQLTEHDNSEWCAIADTYAHLLQISGNKKEAANVTKQVIEKATESKMKDVDSFKKYLKELEK